MRRALITILSAFALLGIGTPALATTSVSPSVRAHVRIAAARLSHRPALILPGQWQSPAGPVLVRECLASYPMTGRAVELLACLTQPDPRRTDRRVMTLHHYHVLHVRHVQHVQR